jgi:hypothetical protein
MPPRFVEVSPCCSCVNGLRFSAAVADHAEYLRDVADITPPPLLPTLLKVLQAAGLHILHVGTSVICLQR